MIYYDTETIGFHGMAALIQWAEDSGPINLHHVWSRPAGDTLDLIEYMMTQSVCGFNLAFDQFHLAKLYTTFSLINPNINPEDQVDEIVEAESVSSSGPCIKPVSAIDLMLHARKGEFQSTMDRKSIRIRKIPAAMGNLLCNHLEQTIQFDDIYFARRKTAGPHWQVLPRKDKEGNIIDPEFLDIVCNFAPSSALKVLARSALNYSDLLLFSDIQIDDHLQPLELGYAPYAKAIMNLEEWPTKNSRPRWKGKYKGSWPTYVHEHKIHWTLSKPKEYATYDVKITRDLHEYFNYPEPGDDDSELACMVGAVRWKGYDLDLEQIEIMRDQAKAKVDTKLIDPRPATKYIQEVLNPIELAIYQELGGGTPKTVLDELAKWEDHPVAERALNIITSRQQNKKRELYDKLLRARRFFASFKVIGTKSSRMSGSDGLNAQGIDRTKEVRRCFPLGPNLYGGDFSSFEVCIFDAVCEDPTLHEFLLTGESIHAVFGQGLYDLEYDEIIETSGTDDDLYGKSKSGLFLTLYGGTGYAMTKLGVTQVMGDKAIAEFLAKYPMVMEKRARMEWDFKPIQSEDKSFVWHEPKMYAESLMGFRRYFNMEFRICRSIFNLAQDLPADWQSITTVCNRSTKRQTLPGAVQSALYGAAHSIQNSVSRAAINHEIQSTGAEVTKRVQRKVWDAQPSGINEWIVQPMQVHDELLCNVANGHENAIASIVNNTVDDLKKYVPLLKLSWTSGKNWAEVH